jgi:AcrR family transcriptional regulator
LSDFYIAKWSVTLGLRERQRVQLQRELSQAGIRLFIEKGFQNTTVDEIVDALGVSRRTFFRHFASKEDVLFLWYDELTGELVAACAARPADEDPFASVCAALYGLLAYYDADPLWARDMVRVTAETPALIGRSLEKRAMWQRALAEVIRSRLPDSRMRDLSARIVSMAAVNAFALGVEAWQEVGEAGDIRSFVDAAFAKAACVTRI